MGDCQPQPLNLQRRVCYQFDTVQLVFLQFLPCVCQRVDNYL